MLLETATAHDPRPPARVPTNLRAGRGGEEEGGGTGRARPEAAPSLAAPSCAPPLTAARHQPTPRIALMGVSMK